MTMRVMPPADGLHPTITVNGRTYTCALGSVIDVPDQDGFVMQSNGWTLSALGGAGPTSARPAPTKGTEFLDTSLGKIIVADGKVWHDPGTGAVV